MLELPRLHSAQERIRHEASRFNVINCGRRFGKTILGEDLIVEPALEGYPVGWFAPEYKLLVEAWRDLRLMLAPIVRRANDNEHRIELITGGVIDAWSFDRSPNAGRSRKYRRVVIDEAAHCDNLEYAWTRCILPTLTDYAGDAFFLSSPFGQNYFKSLYDRGGSEAHDLWRSWTFASYANPTISPHEIDTLRAELPDALADQEYLAKFLADTATQLIPDGWLALAFQARKPGVLGKSRWLAADLSRGSGGDRTVILVADEFGLIDAYADNRVDLPSAASLIDRYRKHHAIPQDHITYDAGGWAGDDIARYLDALGIVAAVPYFGSASGGSRYANRRTRSAWGLRRHLDPNRPELTGARLAQPVDSVFPLIARTHVVAEPPRARLKPPFLFDPSILGAKHAEALREELAALRTRGGGTRKHELERKDDLIERLGHSPDLADTAIMLASLWDDDL